MFEKGEVDLCRDDPGYEVTLIVESSVRALTEIWSGEVQPEQALRRQQVRVLGSRGMPQHLALARRERLRADAARCPDVRAALLLLASAGQRPRPQP